MHTVCLAFKSDNSLCVVRVCVCVRAWVRVCACVRVCGLLGLIRFLKKKHFGYEFEQNLMQH